MLPPNLKKNLCAFSFLGNTNKQISNASNRKNTIGRNCHHRTTIMGRVEKLVVSHSLVFLAGFAAGKLYDRDELNSYRAAHEKPMEKFRRYSGNAIVGLVGLGTMYVIVKLSSRGGGTTES
jgi:hypothetical protein